MLALTGDDDDPRATGPDAEETAGPSGDGVTGAPLLERLPSPGRIAFTVFSNDETETGMWVVEGDGTNLRHIETGIMGCVSPVGGLAWDGASVLQGEQNSDCEGLLLLPLDGSEPTVLDGEGFCARGCDFSPDGRRIVYNRASESAYAELVIADLDDLDTSLVIGSGDSPEWSADGSKIVYAPGYGEVAIFDVAREISNPIAAAPGGLFEPAFDPAGERIVGATQADDGTRNGLRIVDLTTGATTAPCSGDTELADSPSWSPDGGSIVFSDGSASLKVCDLISDTVWALPRAGYSSQNPSWR
jgi:Tol biopolymer transport system component